MKKVIIAFDGSHFSYGAFEFARSMNEMSRILLTGVFLPRIDYANLWSYSDAGLSGPSIIPLIDETDVEASKQTIKEFETLCINSGMEFRVHEDIYGFALPQLKKESRFADLLVVGSEVFYRNTAEGKMNEYLKDTLHSMECPVVTVPENSSFPSNNILAYDGTESAVYAIKQFSYLFPELLKLPTVLVYAKEGNSSGFPDQSFIQEYIVPHFNHLKFVTLNADPRKHFATWVSEKTDAILVAGSYERSAFSELFKKSFVQEIILDHKLPVFIAHK